MNYTLSPMDYYFFRPNLYTIQFVFEYQGRMDLTDLRSRVNKTVKTLPVITCRLKEIPGQELVLENRNETVPIMTTELICKPNIENQLVIDSMIDPVSNLPDEPLLRLKLTYYENTTYLGISFSHMLGDGFSFLLFLKSLTGDERFSASHERNKLFLRTDEKRRLPAMERLFENSGYITPRPPNPTSSQMERIFISHEEIDRLKRKIKGVSANSIIMAILIKKFHHHIPLTSDGQLIVRCPVDYRKLRPDLGDHYFGNAVRDALAFFDPATIDDLSLAEVAMSIQKSIAAINEKSIQDTLQVLDDLRKEKGLSIFNQLGCPGLLVTNLTKFPFEEIDLGNGTPMAIHHASQNPRVAVILSHPKGMEIRFKKPRIEIKKTAVQELTEVLSSGPCHR